jgi:hypothetical protein
VPAYARYIATSENNFLSDTWRVNSEATNRAAAWRTVSGGSPDSWARTHSSNFGLTCGNAVCERNAKRI